MDFTKLMQDPLMLQMLLAGGQDLLSAQPFGQNLGAAAMQTLGASQQAKASDRYMKMLSQMLSGEMVPGSSMKMSDKGEVTFNLPAFSGGGGDIGSGGTRDAMRSAYQHQATGVTSVDPVNQVQSINPFRQALRL